MNSSLHSPARWTIRATGLAVVAAAVMLPAANAEATCMVMSGIRYCGPSSTTNPLWIAIGSDPYGHWIVYKDTVTQSCTWDMIGSASAFYNTTVVTGTSHDDTMSTVGSNGTVFCGMPLNPPSPGGSNWLSLNSGGGYDYMLSYLPGPSVTLSCGGHPQACYFETWGGTIVGSESHDYVVKNGSGSWQFQTNGGGDIIQDYGSGAVGFSDCGAGTDHFHGTWNASTVNCEVR